MSLVQKHNSRLSYSSRMAAARIVIKLFDNWKLSTSDQLMMLGLNELNSQELECYRNGCPLRESRDIIDRVGYMLCIHAELRVIFNQDNNLIYGWITASVKDFDYLTPIEVTRRYGLIGLNMLCHYLVTIRKN